MILANPNGFVSHDYCMYYIDERFEGTLMVDGRKTQVFPTAEEDVAAAHRVVPTERSGSPAYRLAYADHEFLLRDELRPVRLQLELLKAELGLEEHEVRSTVVVFGSSRIPDEAAAREELRRAEQAAAKAPEDQVLAAQVRIARNVMGKSRYYEVARDFGRLVSEHTEPDCVVATGGGPGIMEAANRGASDAGAASIGFNIVLPHEQAPNDFITPGLCFQFHYFAIRKMHFLLRARALAAFPGGFGTLDELFETLTLIQTAKIQPIPVLLFGEQYWRKIIDFNALVAEGVISPEDLELFSFVESAEQGWATIERFYQNGVD